MRVGDMDEIEDVEESVKQGHVNMSSWQAERQVQSNVSLPKSPRTGEIVRTSQIDQSPKRLTNPANLVILSCAGPKLSALPPAIDCRGWCCPRWDAEGNAAAPERGESTMTLGRSRFCDAS